MSRSYYTLAIIEGAKGIPDIQGEREIITSAIGSVQDNHQVSKSDASGDAWRALTSPAVSEADSVPGWSEILPTPNGYGLEHYTNFFVTYTARIAAPPTYNEKGPVLPTRKYVEDWVNNPVWQARHQLAGKERARQVLDLYDSVESEYKAGCFDDCVERVFDMFEKMLGIDKRLMPAMDAKNTHDSVVRGTKQVKGRHWLPHDIKDIMLWLYLREDNARRDAKQRLRDQADAAKLDEFENDVPEDQKTAGGALEVRAAQKLLKKLNTQTPLTPAEKELLRALASNNKDFFASKVRETDQCLLRLNIENFSSQYYSLGPAKHDPMKQRRNRPHKAIYQDSMSPATVINKLAYSPNSGPFLGARTHELSQLIPMIRLYKSYYNNDTNDIDEEVEFYFDGGVSLEQAMESRTGVGIKSFEWDLNATNPATVKNDITATLVLYFQGFNELIKTRQGYDIINGKSKDFQYQDLLLRPRRGASQNVQNTSAPPIGSVFCNSRDNSIHDHRFYEIKALVGWAPVDSLEATRTVKYEKSDGSTGLHSPLVKSVRSQQIPLFLTLIDHEFSFTQEGTYELKITYRARMEAMNSDPRLDVLTTPSRKIIINDLLEQVKESEKSCDSKDSIQDIKDAIALEREADRDLLASSIINGLEPHIYVTKVNTESIHKILLGVDDSGTPDDQIAVRAVSISQKQVKDSIISTDSKLKKSIIEELNKKQVDSSGQGTRKQREEAEAAVSSGGKSEDLAAFDPSLLSDAKNNNIAWFYFGDLVDVVVTHAIDNNTVGNNTAPGIIPGIELENLTYLMGTYDYTRVGSWYYPQGQTGLKILTPSQLSREVGLLSAVPVTVASYNSWFIKNVVNSERSSFPLAEFLRSFIQQVIVPILNRKCFDTDEFKRLFTDGSNIMANDWIEIAPLIPKTAAISLPPAFRKNNTNIKINPLEKFRTYPQQVRTSSGPIISSSEINLRLFKPPQKDSSKSEGRIPTRRENSHQQTIKDSYHLSVFYLVGQDSYKELGPPPSGEDREDRDYKKGIYHLYLGADSGLVKEVTFSKVDAPYLREARIQQDSLNPLAQLAATYNVNLKMVGNTIFWPGQYIFVNPIGFGSGLKAPYELGSVSNQLGLGGYHLITHVKSYVEDGKYETTVKGLFEFSGDGCPSLPQSTPTDPCEPPSDPGATTTTNTGAEVPTAEAAWSNLWGWWT